MASTVLVVTALEDFTADKVITALNEREVPVVRVDPADIGPGLAFGFRIGEDSPAWGGRLRTGSREVELGEVAAVYYRRPTPYAARFGHLPSQQRDFCVAEARHGVGGVLNHLHGPTYVNHPAAVTAADFKPAQLRRFAELGLAIPPTLVTNDVEQVRKFAAGHEHVIYKPFRGLPAGEDGHAGAIWAQRVDPDSFDDSLTVTAHLFQAEIPKTGDVRVTVVGANVFAQQIAAPDGALDWRRGDWDELIHAPITRTHAAPVFGNPAHWAAGLPDKPRTARQSPERITAATEEAFHLRFLAQSAVPDAQMVTVGETVHLVDVVTGSAATLTPADGGWRVREGGPVKLWERIERVLDAYDTAGAPGPDTFTLHVYDGGQHLRHEQMPGLPLPGP